MSVYANVCMWTFTWVGLYGYMGKWVYGYMDIDLCVIVYMSTCVYVHVCVYVYMKSSFPKRDKHHYKKCAFYANAKVIDYVLDKCIPHICTYMYIMKSPFPKQDL